MQKKDWEELEKIIDKVLAFPKEEQETQLKKLCKDGSQYEEALELLTSIEESESFFEERQQGLRSFVNDLLETSDLSGMEQEDFVEQNFGVYTSTAKIDQGGMGTVYKARRADGEFEREVAVKVLNSRLLNNNWEKRFNQEKVILASLEHPNIAKLYDAGVSEANRPYLVMEYVEGRSLMEYVKEKKPSLEERLEKFRTICQAIDYAHHNLIVHRDLKPQNVLINDKGEVKVLDFGIAKVLSEELTPEEVVQTIESNRILSLNYAAPEQINMGKITVATDVYALGLLLYELLTEQKAFDLSGTTLRQAEKVILDREISKVSERCKVEFKKTDPKDLDAIVNKCLRKEPGYRYPSVSELIEDLHNLVSNMPVAARKNTRVYKARKFIRRNKLKLMVSASFVIAAITFAIIYNVNVTKEKNRALEALGRAKLVSDVVVSIFEEVDYTKTNDPRLATSKFLDESLAMVEYKFSDAPGEKARLLLNFGSIKYNLGDLETADSLFDEASSILGSLGEQDEYRYWLADVYNKKADLSRAMGKTEKSVLYADSLEQFLRNNEEQIKSLEIVSLDWQAYLLTSMSYKAENYTYLGEFGKAESLYTEMFNRYAFRGDTLSDAYWVMRHDHGWFLSDQGKYEEATSTFREVVKARTRGLEKGRLYYSPTKVAGAHSSLAWVLHLQDLSEDAEKHARKSLEIYNDTFGEKPSIERAKAMNDLGIIIQKNGNYGEAKELISQAYYMRKDLLGDTHPLTLKSEGNMGLVYFFDGQKQKALEWFIKAHKSNVKVKGPTHPDYLRELSNIGAVYMQIGENERAKDYFKKALDMGEKYFDTTNVIYSKTLSAYNSIK